MLSRQLLISAAVVWTAGLGPATAQWDIQDAHTKASLRGIHSLGGGVAWASGTSGTVLRTEDGGYVWQLCAVPPGADKLDFRGVQGFDNKIAIVMSSGKGDLSRLYKTVDGCQTWKLVATNPDAEGFWDALQFDSGSRPKYVYGTLIGDPVNGEFVIYKTNDKGEHWQRWLPSKTRHPAKANKDESLFAASNSAMVMPGNNGDFAFVTGGKGGSRFFSEQNVGFLCDCVDDGFRISDLPMGSNESAGAFSVARRAAGSRGIYADLMVIGGDYAKPDSPGTSAFIPNLVPVKALVSRRMIAATTPPHGYRSAVAYDAAAKLWITVGPNGTDVSTDDGRNWQPLTPGPDQPAAADRDWNALSLPFVVGPHGRIGKLRADALTANKPALN